jgi:hypothetical protein
MILLGTSIFIVWLLFGGVVIGILGRFDPDIRKAIKDGDRIVTGFYALIWPFLLLFGIAAGMARTINRWFERREIRADICKDES